MHRKGSDWAHLYINDIVNIDTKVKYVIYVNDTGVFFWGNDAEQIIQNANQFLIMWNYWATSNSLQIMSTKQKPLYLDHEIQTVCMSVLSLGANNIDRMESVKVVGIIFNQFMVCDDTNLM